MSQEYLPVPFKDFRHLLGQVYQHLFPPPDADNELSDAIDAAVAEIEVEASNRPTSGINPAALRDVHLAAIKNFRDDIADDKLNSTAAMLQPAFDRRHFQIYTREQRKKIIVVPDGPILQLFHNRRDKCRSEVRR